MKQVELNDAEIDAIARSLRIEMIDNELLAKRMISRKSTEAYTKKADFLHGIIKKLGR